MHPPIPRCPYLVPPGRDDAPPFARCGPWLADALAVHAEWRSKRLSAVATAAGVVCSTSTPQRSTV
jgi:hypothetical protein